MWPAGPRGAGSGEHVTVCVKFDSLYKWIELTSANRLCTDGVVSSDLLTTQISRESGGVLEQVPADLTAMEETVEGSMVVIGSVEQRREQTSQQQLHSSTGITAPADDGREEWSDASKLLFQSGYYKVLKEMALSGQIQLYNIRGVCWKLFLGCLPEPPSEWEEASRKSREHFDQIRKRYLTDPHSIGVSLDVTFNNPLSQSENSPWHQFFQDNELRQVIEQDVVRTFPDVQFFKQQSIQDTMQDLLFCYAKEHPEVSYRQGMHELLAPVLFVLHSEMRDVNNDPSLAPVLRVVMDPYYIEHDAFAIFTELMENMQPWYMFTALEADEARVRVQNASKMISDPRTQKPFDRNSCSAPTSAITRKLDVIQHVLLKKADPVLYHHLTKLAIPAQTYGIRWIRLLFGREFPLPTVLELWDALFADGPSLSLVDYMCVAMLMHIREVLIEGDYTMCMQHLMHFPLVYEVNYLVQRALHSRSPASYPSPRVWTYRPGPAHDSPLAATRRFHPKPHPPNTSQTSGSSGGLSRAGKAGILAKQMLSNARLPKALSKQVAAKTEATPTAREHSPTAQPSHPPHLNPLRAKRRALSETREQEMKNNPKSQPRPSGSSNQLERLTTRLDDMEAKCHYCGSKMDSLLSALQEEVTELPDLTPSAENTIYLSLAGLKQVRDLLLNKIQFSGEMAEDLEEGPAKEATPTNKDEDGPASPGPASQDPGPTSQDPGPTSQESSDHEHSSLADSTATTHATPELGQEAEPALLAGAEATDFHPLLSSGETPLGPLGHTLPGGAGEGRVCEGVQWEGVPEEEWVHLSPSHSDN